MRRSAPGLVLPLVAAAALVSCPSQIEVPGSTIGAFRFEATLLQDGCGFDRSPDGGRPAQIDPEPFVATLSYDPKDGRAWLISGATRLEGTLEGDHFTVEGHAKRELPSPCGCAGSIVERVEGTLHGEALKAAGGCGAQVPDAGAEPLLQDGGSAVRLVCGFLSDELSAIGTDGCTCPPCLVVYTIAGERE